MICMVVAEMMKVCASPSKQASTEVTKKMVAKYPQSLQDVREGDVVRPGYHSLVKQLQVRIENTKQSLRFIIVGTKQESDGYYMEEIPAEKGQLFRIFTAVQDIYSHMAA